MITVDKVELQFYQSEWYDLITDYHLPEEQVRFTALPIEMLEISHERHPIMIVSNHVPVGFFVLHSSDRVKEYTDNPNAMLLTAFSVNHSQQGKGYAKKGLEQLPIFINREFPNCDEIVLSVNKLNVHAQKVYERVGYIDTGRRRPGKMGEQLILSLSL
ncbi:GNAT family N-acetyltransferase [Heyndrickxia oleronia]|jgi:RimJ/RimL family protein N-acetyltransferase|uniref:GNAT family N-acetyltransferase n=1 Tax=Heyndrickxia oleronia TaxID=38875 RepID=A0AAW6T677_9BACI|nr:GNAT family N-acetyltransferase [Heyndrickxia oleronia]MCM3240489.1 GNAT family N-acetyltransferase [Heyndrickxia oleronia]MDH5164527.1 GNAT family N-acetyltransferase [Heyndrickxia oleronia]